LHHFAHIRVVGIGSGGITAVNHMVDRGINGVDFITVDVDVESLRASRAPLSIHIGSDGVSPLLSRSITTATELEAERLLQEALLGSDMVFIVGGLGGKTATRLAPRIAALARREEALTTAIMTTPFAFEGKKRARLAEKGVQRLRKEVNTLIVIPNERLLELAGGTLPFHETYRQARDVWYQSIQGINELVNAPGLVNVDFADVRTIMATGGASIIATGRARGGQRATVAAEQATRSPYLDVTIDGARGVLFNVSGGADMTLHEVTDIAALIRGRVHPDANIIFGATIDVALEDEIQVTVIATGCGLSLADTGLLPTIAAKVMPQKLAVPIPAHYG
jgi:cell division protein FtsZ